MRAKERGLVETEHLGVRERLKFVEIPPEQPQEEFSNAVLSGLSKPQKTLPSRFFYDQAGSQLFEDITALPEYYLTCTEETILEEYAPEMVASVGERIALVEFGSGSSCKTRLLIEASIARQGLLEYTPIDISAKFLQSSATRLLRDYGPLNVTALAAEYFAGIKHLPKVLEPRLVLFLGSNIGNFEREEALSFLSNLRAELKPSDRVLIGVDRVKDVNIIEAAYNDQQGVTEAFNKNILKRINRELGANFDLKAFEHLAPFIPEHSRVEMRLVSKTNQKVKIRELRKEFAFAKGEYIHTENSHKYTPEAFEKLASEAKLQVDKSWTDERQWFTVFLLRPTK
jgi:dimethylhistidine N-methyltransferase